MNWDRFHGDDSHRVPTAKVEEARVGLHNRVSAELCIQWPDTFDAQFASDVADMVVDVVSNFPELRDVSAAVKGE